MEAVEGGFESQIALLTIAILFALCSNWFALRNGFYTFPSRSPALYFTLTIQHLLIIFLGYFFLQSVLVPTLVYTFLSFLSGEGLQLQLPISENWQVWINIGSMFVSMLLIWLLGRYLEPELFHSIIEERGEKHHWKSVWKNFCFGIKAWLVAFPLSLVLGLVMEWIVTTVLHPPEADQLAVQNFRRSFAQPVQFWLTLIGIVFVVPAAEEFVFRGFLQTWLRQRIGIFSAIIGTSLLFASFHYASIQGWHNLEILPPLFLLSCFLGFIFERQRSLWASIGLHATFNFVSVCLIVLQNSKGE